MADDFWLKFAKSDLEEKKEYLTKKKYAELSAMLEDDKLYPYTVYSKVKRELHKAEIRHQQWYEMEPETLREVRKKYIGQQVAADKAKDSDWFLMGDELSADYSEMDRFGEEIRYYAMILLEEGRVSDVLPLECETYLWSDVRGDGYRRKRADEIDYMRLDKKLSEVIVFPEKPNAENNKK